MTATQVQATAQAVAMMIQAPAIYRGQAFCIHPGETSAEVAARHDPHYTPGTRPRWTKDSIGVTQVTDPDEPPAIEAEAWTYDPDRYCPACGRRGKWILRAARLELHNVSALRFLEDLRPAPPQGELF